MPTRLKLIAFIIGALIVSVIFISIPKFNPPKQAEELRIEAEQRAIDKANFDIFADLAIKYLLTASQPGFNPEDRSRFIVSNMSRGSWYIVDGRGATWQGGISCPAPCTIDWLKASRTATLVDMANRENLQHPEFTLVEFGTWVSFENATKEVDLLFHPYQLTDEEIAIYP